MKLFQSLKRVARRKTELNEELEVHLRMAVADRVARGESAEDARREVMWEFGNVPLVADVTRERRRWIWLEISCRPFDTVGGRCRSSGLSLLLQCLRWRRELEPPAGECFGS
jgi:hypothetical protein